MYILAYIHVICISDILYTIYVWYIIMIHVYDIIDKVYVRYV